MSAWLTRLLAVASYYFQVDDVHPFYSDLLNVLYDKVGKMCGTVQRLSSPSKCWRWGADQEESPLSWQRQQGHRLRCCRQQPPSEVFVT
jgi:hypothetical protein